MPMEIIIVTPMVVSSLTNNYKMVAVKQKYHYLDK